MLVSFEVNGSSCFCPFRMTMGREGWGWIIHPIPLCSLVRTDPSANTGAKQNNKNRGERGREDDG